MSERKNDKDRAATPMGDVFLTGFRPVRVFFNDISRRAQSAFLNFNDRLNSGIMADDHDRRDPPGNDKSGQ